MLIVVAGSAPSVETYDLTSSAPAWTLRNENFLYTESERIGTRGVTLNNVFHVTGNNWSEEYYLISSSQAGTSSGPGSPRLVTGDLSPHSVKSVTSTELPWSPSLRTFSSTAPRCVYNNNSENLLPSLYHDWNKLEFTCLSLNFLLIDSQDFFTTENNSVRERRFVHLI